MVRIAGVSHGTFYLYFANKEELIRALAERCADEADELAAALPPISADAEGRDVLRAWLADYLDVLPAARGGDPDAGPRTRWPTARSPGSAPSPSGASR